MADESPNIVNRIHLGDIGQPAMSSPLLDGSMQEVPGPRPAMLFVARKYPPAVGGMELLSLQVYQSFARTDCELGLIALGRSQWHLLWWLPLTVLRVAGLVARRRVDWILASDALTYMVVKLASALGRARVSTVACGLDLTWPHPIYQLLLKWLLPKANRVVAISSATAQEAIKRGVEATRLSVVRPGIADPPRASLSRAEARRQLLSTIGAGSDAVVLLTLGRLVRRKGVRWFLSNVLPSLPSECVYVVAGAGPEEGAIRQAVRAAELEGRVHLLGRVSSDDRERLLIGADIFVQPNIKVSGDIEGFGLVVVEAAMRGTPVVAAALEGITDAIIDGETGKLVESGNAGDFIRAIKMLAQDSASRRRFGEHCRKRAEELFSASRMEQDLEVIFGLRRVRQ